MTVHQAAELLSCSADTIRRWEKKGLVKSHRSENNYRVFELAELERLLKKNSSSEDRGSYKILKSDSTSSITSVELFAGCGGTALGMENAGIEHLMLNEIDKNAVATLKTNRPNWNVIHDDISNIDFSVYKNKVDIIQGGFPCQSFSFAGKKMGFEDVRGTLFFEFARAVKEAEPKIAIGENVRGLLKHDDGRTLLVMISVLEDLGYKVAYKVLRAQYLDVPQKRERLIIIAIRKDLDLPFIFPKERDHTVSIRSALKNCPKSDGQSYPPKKKAILDLIPQGGYWRDLPEELQREYMGASYFMGGGKTGMARRLSWDEPSLTLTCSPAQKQTERCHPEETRPLTVREYARIQTFPDEWVFAGSTASQYKQIGNAVPVNLGYHLGKSVLTMLGVIKQEESMEITEPLISNQLEFQF